MAMDGWRTALLAACLAGIVAGCHGIPTAPAGAGSTPQQQGNDEGWLDRLMGREAKAKKADPAVRQASAEEPVPENIENALHASPTPGQAEAEQPEEKKGFSLSDLSPVTLYEEAKKAAGYGLDEKLARQLFDEGEDLYRQKKYAEAAEKFKGAATHWPNSVLEEDAMFYRGESLFFADRYVEANDVFGELLKKHENSRYLDQVVHRQFKIARYWEKLQDANPLWPVVPNFTDSTRPTFDTWGNALKVYENIQLNDPTGPLADDAVMAMGNAYFLKHRYEDAAYQYDLLRKEYPKSSHQYDAHRLALKSKLMMYQGPYYDGTPLEDAGKIADQTLRQFPAEMGKDRQQVITEKNEIAEKEAQRDWEMGQYYDQKGYYGAARLYYQGLVNSTRLGRTTFAEKARKRLVEIKDKPAKPVNHFKWLTNLFPSGG